MAVPPESIEVGKCCLMLRGEIPHVRYVAYNSPDERVHYLDRTAKKHWRPAVQERQYFASTTEREVPSDWTPEAGGVGGEHSS